MAQLLFYVFGYIQTVYFLVLKFNSVYSLYSCKDKFTLKTDFHSPISSSVDFN